jgi:hypothetical protein
MAHGTKTILVAARLVGLQVGYTRKGSFAIESHCATTRYSRLAREDLARLRRLQRGLEIILGGRY